jgi:hypothetical protein
MRVLFATTILPSGKRTGSEIATSAFIEALRDGGHHLSVLGYRRHGDTRPPGAGETSAGDRHIESSDAGARTGWWMLRALATRDAYSSAKYVSGSYRAALAEALRERPAVVVVDHAQLHWCTPAVRDLGIPLVYLAHNVERDVYDEAAHGARGPLRLVNRREARRIGRAEKALASQAAAVWTLSAADAEKLRHLAGGGPVRSFALPPAVEPVSQPDRTTDVGILGTWTWKPNAAGLSWYLERVQPLLPPGTRTAIAGAGAGFAQSVAGVSYLGRVPDAAAFLGASRVVAVPSVAGGGLQIKTLDAIATTRPVVATSVAMRGIDDPPPSVTVCDAPEHFARALTSFLRDEAAGTAAAAAEWVSERRKAFAAAVGEAAAAVGPAGEPELSS